MSDGVSGDERERVIAEDAWERFNHETPAAFWDVAVWRDELWDVRSLDVADRKRIFTAAVAAALPTPAPEYVCDCQPTADGLCAAKANPEDCGARRVAPAGEDATLTAEEKAAVAGAAGHGPDAELTPDLIAAVELILAQRGAADRATLAAVRAEAARLVEAAQTIAPPPEQTAWETRRRDARAWADALLPLLDGPDAGGGRRE